MISTPRCAHLDPEVRITYYGTDATPYNGDYQGIEGAVILHHGGDDIEIVAMEA